MCGRRSITVSSANYGARVAAHLSYAAGAGRSWGAVGWVMTHEQKLNCSAVTWQEHSYTARVAMAAPLSLKCTQIYLQEKTGYRLKLFRLKMQIRLRVPNPLMRFNDNKVIFAGYRTHTKNQISIRLVLFFKRVSHQITTICLMCSRSPSCQQNNSDPQLVSDPSKLRGCGASTD